MEKNNLGMKMSVGSLHGKVAKSSPITGSVSGGSSRDGQLVDSGG